MCANDSNAHAVLFLVLAAGLAMRWSVTGAISDLQESIDITRRGIKVATEDDDPNLPHLYRQLGQSLEYVYERTHDMQTLDESITMLRLSLALSLDDPYKYTRARSNLSSSIERKYKVMGCVDDLEEAVSFGQQALELSRKDDSVEKSDRVMFLQNLAASMELRYQALHDVADLQESINLSEEAISDTDEDDSVFAPVAMNLARYLCRMYEEHNKSLRMLYEARFLLVAAIYQESAYPVARARAATMIMHLINDWSEVYEISRYALNLLTEGVTESLSLEDKQFMMASFSDLASTCVEAALHLGKRGVPLVKILEKGRGKIASSILNRKLDVGEL